MNRCTLCLYPDTKPDLHFDVNGICSACRNYRNRPTIDWEERKRALVDILSDAEPNGSGFDCIVPSSGGKDSHYQVLTLLELGARPLVVTASTDYLTPVGRKNIDNLARYATTIEVTPNRAVRGKLCRLGLELVGDPSWPEHATIFSTPIRVARDLGIPLIFYGENPQAEYGGPLGSEQAQAMTRRWVTEFGGFLGLRPQDFIGHYGITAADMEDYLLPDDWDGVSVYFLGQFIPWDSRRNAARAEAAGMLQELPSPANWWKFENLDNAVTGLHDHLMYRKYSYGRMVGQLGVDIRSGFVTREEALEVARGNDGLFPWAYADVSIYDVLDFMGLDEAALFAALDLHTNWALFDGVKDGRPILREWKDC